MAARDVSIRPTHVLLIVIDDLGWADLSCYGSSFYETPRLDALARRGVRFTDAYATSPVCSPTRASILTGRYPARVGITNWIPGNPWGRLVGAPFFHALPRSEVTVAAALRDAGYRTAHIGKWHLGGDGHGPRDFGFDLNVGGCHLGHPPSYFSPYRNPALSDGPDGEYLTDRLTDEALTLLAEHADGGPHDDEPLFLNLWHYAVHTPIQAPADLIEKFRHKAVSLGLDSDAALVEGEAFPCLHKKDQRLIRRIVQSDPAYAAMIENLDINIGRLLDGLAQLGLADDTIILFTSDNGGLSTAEGSPTCNAPLSEGKGWMAEGGNRVCLLAAGAGVTAVGSTCRTAVTSADLMPTMLEAVGVDLPEGVLLDGRSFLPALHGDTLDDTAIFWHYPHYSNQGGTPACAIRSGEHKLIEYFEDSRPELFHLPSDPGEQHNLAPTEPAQCQALHDQLRRWRTNLEAHIPGHNPFYHEMLKGSRPCPDDYGHLPGDD